VSVTWTTRMPGIGMVLCALAVASLPVIPLLLESESSHRIGCTLLSYINVIKPNLRNSS